MWLIMNLNINLASTQDFYKLVYAQAICQKDFLRSVIKKGCKRLMLKNTNPVSKIHQKLNRERRAATTSGSGVWVVDNKA